jgi:hypothetical protein
MKQIELQLINTVNVIEITNGTLQGVRAWNDDQIGNEQAELVFRAFLKENTNLTDGQIDMCVEEGHYATNGYEIFLTHSIAEEKIPI